MKYLNIEVVKGGFILSYTVERAASSGNSTQVLDQEREVFTTQSKVTKRVKELLDFYTGGEAKDVE